MTARRKMDNADWFNGAVLFAVGLYLGLALDALITIAGTPFWPLAILMPILGGLVYLGALFLDRLSNRILPGGLRPAKGSDKLRRPLALLAALPLGLVVGLIGAQFGLTALLLG